MRIPRINRSELGILVIDVQPLFVNIAFPEMGEAHEALMMRLEHLLMLAGWMELPLIATFEKPFEENGHFPDRLESVFPDHGQRFVKNHFDAMSEEPIRKAVEKLPGRQIAVAGAETDVCVMQTVNGLLELGFQVFLLEDCLFTSESEPGPSLRRMYQAGAVPCTMKSMAYELVACVDNVAWYLEEWSSKDDPDARPFPDKFIPPEEWPAWELKL